MRMTGATLDREVQRHIRENPGTKYSEAMQAVRQRDPALFAAYALGRDVETVKVEAPRPMRCYGADIDVIVHETMDRHGCSYSEGLARVRRDPRHREAVQRYAAGRS